MLYDLWNPFDPDDGESPEEQKRIAEQLALSQNELHAMLPELRLLINDSERDIEAVHALLRPIRWNMTAIPVSLPDLPEVEALCRLALESGGHGQNLVQENMLRLVGNTAHPQSLPFLHDMLYFTRQRDHFGPERRQLAIWALARLAKNHNLSEAYDALLTGLDDRHADVRLTTIGLLLDAHLMAGRDVPAIVVDKLGQLATNDRNDDVRRRARKCLREPWAKVL